MSDSIATQIGAIAGYISLCLMIAGTLIAAINHRRISSECCGRKGSVSLDISATTPPDKQDTGKPTVVVSPE